MPARGDERGKLERLCRYISRPAVSEKRLSLTPNGNVRYQLKTPYRHGTTHVIFEPLEFIAQLQAALVPRPRVNLTRFHGAFGIDIETCPTCGVAVRIIACIEGSEDHR